MKQPPPQSMNALEASVEQTRQDIAVTLSALQTKVQPSAVISDARDALMGGAQNAITGAEGAVRDLMNAVQQHLPNAPLAEAALGAVVAWLATIGQRTQAASGTAAETLGSAAADATTQAHQGADQLANHVRERVTQATNDLQTNAGEAVARAQTQIGQEFAQLEQLVGKNPWLVSALALGVGIAIGVALPETEQERALYGQARAAMGGQVQTAIHGVLGALAPKAAPPPTPAPLG
ncbi:MAG: DUF3618 domain-containing protein [Ktedonobacterales bacterium]|nr:DUF3618 domain-containing protein [Ktedonobacterales bacterium]